MDARGLASSLGGYQRVQRLASFLFFGLFPALRILCEAKVQVMEIFIRTEPSAREKAHTNCCVLEGNTVSPSFHTQIPAPVGRQSLDFLVLRFKVSSLVLHQEGPVELRKTGKTGLTRSHSHRFWVSFPDNVLAPKK